MRWPPTIIFKNYTQDPTGLPNEALENSDAILEFTSVGDE